MKITKKEMIVGGTFVVIVLMLFGCIFYIASNETMKNNQRIEQDLERNRKILFK